MSNILVLSSSYPRYPGDPAGNFIDRLIDTLLKMGSFNFTILAPWDAQVEKPCQNHPKKRLIHFRYVWPPSFHRLAYGDGMAENLRANKWCALQVPVYCLSLFFSCLRRIRHAHLLHAHWLIPSGLVGAILSRLTGKKLIVTVHGSDLQILRKTFYGRVMLRFICQNASLVTVTSEYGRNLMLQILEGSHTATLEKIRAIPMGVDHAHTKTKKNRAGSEKKVVYVGRLIPTKGVDLLLEALSGLPNTSLIIAGEGPQKKTLQEKAEQLGIKTKFLGHLPSYQIGDLLAVSDCVVIPSRDENEGVAEGTPLVLLEAVAAGCWVVGSAVGGIPEVIRHYPKGVLVDPQSVASLRQAILLVLTKSEVTPEAKGFQTEPHLAKYSLKNVAQTWNDIYQTATS